MNHFSEANDVGGGGYGKVYKGILPSGQLIAIKRAQQESLQGGLELKTEIELHSKVHHKNVVKLMGFALIEVNKCSYMSTFIMALLEIVSQNEIRLDWTKRLKIALGSRKGGLAYLHELADPPIIHRDVKSHYILLDENLTAKVADFGISKLVGDREKTHVTTQVKGSMKSNVYEFGVVMLELLTGQISIEKGNYVVKVVKKKMDKARSLYDLHELLDTTVIASSGNLKGFEKYVDLALRCIVAERVNKPSMGEVVKDIENILQLAGLDPSIDSTVSSRIYEEASDDPDGKESFPSLKHLVNVESHDLFLVMYH
ncbi:unnamed protein product [Thlaspi arvense]|uniref:Protein kinase domain-containing protein n=1 Tax=Thlaspi arvense TaxID=13288 RepID=A0AAU9SLP5_THLAR|nr:unnamed protein product [Thlaspi arvense]